MNLEELKQKLRSYKKSEIIITDHAKIRALVRDMDLNEVRENIINPEKLSAFKEVEAEKNNERKFECYFAYSKFYCHKYVLTVNGKIIIVTIININRDWQKMIK